MLKEQGVEQLVLTSDGIQPQATAIFDPLSEAAQRAAPVLLALRDVLGLKVRLVLAPDPELSEMPLQKYYRFSTVWKSSSSALQSGVSRGRSEVLLGPLGRVHQRDVVSEFGPKTWPR